MPAIEGPSFLAVDLEVWSTADLAPLGRALETECSVLHVGRVEGRCLASFEVHGDLPEDTIWRFLQLVKALRGSPRRLWREAESRVFHLGFESGGAVELLYETPAGSGVWKRRGRVQLNACQTSLGPEVLRAIAAVRGTVMTTIYPPRREMRLKERKPGTAT
jgi:hypothetical protein